MARGKKKFGHHCRIQRFLLNSISTYTLQRLTQLRSTPSTITVSEQLPLSNLPSFYQVKNFFQNVEMLNNYHLKAIYTYEQNCIIYIIH